MDGISDAVVVEAVTAPRRGRKPGSKNRRTIEVEAVMRPMIPKARKRLLAMLRGADDELAFRAAQLTFAYVYGRPRERHEMTGADGKDLLPVNPAAQIPRLATALAVLLPDADNSQLFDVASRMLGRLGEQRPALALTNGEG